MKDDWDFPIWWHMIGFISSIIGFCLLVPVEVPSIFTWQVMKAGSIIFLLLIILYSGWSIITQLSKYIKKSKESEDKENE